MKLDMARRTRYGRSASGPPKDVRFKSFDVRTAPKIERRYSSDSDDSSVWSDDYEYDDCGYRLLDEMCGDASSILSYKPDKKPATRPQRRDVSGVRQPSAPPRSSGASHIHSSSRRQRKRQTEIMEKLNPPMQSSPKGRPSKISGGRRHSAPPRGGTSHIYTSSPRHRRRQTEIMQKLKSPKQSGSSANVKLQFSRIESRQDDNDSEGTDDSSYSSYYERRARKSFKNLVFE